MKDKILNFIDQDKKLKDINKEINDINKEIYSLKKEKHDEPLLIPVFIDRDISILEEKLKVKKEQQSQLIDARSYFIFKLFWNIVVPILVSIITTFLINIYLR